MRLRSWHHCRERRLTLTLDLQPSLQHTASSSMSQGSLLRAGLQQAAWAQQGCQLMAFVSLLVAECSCAYM